MLALAVVNGSGPSRLTPTELVLINALTVGVLIAGARFLSLGPSQSALTKVQYDRTDLLASGRVDDALSDLADRTGLAAESFEVLAVDLVNKTATLRVRHSERSRDRRSAEPSTITFDLVRDLSSNGKNGQG